MFYFGHSNKWPECKYDGEGFKVGDVVEVNVDRIAKTVKYLVNGVQKASHSN